MEFRFSHLIEPLPELFYIKCLFPEDFHGGWIDIFTEDRFVSSLLLKYAPKFGILHHHGKNWEYSLEVKEMYKAKEVADYLQERLFRDVILHAQDE